MKQTLQRRKLLSRTAPMCLVESQWTLLGLWLLGLMCVARIIAAKRNPKKWSVAASRDGVRQALRNQPPRRRAKHTLDQWLALALTDAYRRDSDKTARNYPRVKKERPPRPPIIKSAQRAEIKRAKGLAPPQIELKWTA